MTPTAATILDIIQWAGVPLGLFAFVHAATQRPDAYAAADRKTKQVWMGITGAGTAAMLLLGFVDGMGMLFWIAGLVAVLVYLVDVRPKLIEVQRGGRNW